MQVYIDGKPEGKPFGQPNEYTGRIEDSETYDNGLENDKQMRNLGWMKAPLVFVDGYYVPVRHNVNYIRKIVTKKYLDKGRHKIRFRLVGEYPVWHELDYIEFVPLHIISDPTKPEDRH